MEQATSTTTGKKGRKRGREPLRDKLAVTSEEKLKEAVPEGSRFQGYEDALVQNLQISVAETRYRRERWEIARGELVVASLPLGIIGGFGPELRRFIAAGHFQGQVTSGRLAVALNGMGPQTTSQGRNWLSANIIWVKPKVADDLPQDVVGYAARNLDFPQQSTSRPAINFSTRLMGELSLGRILAGPAATKRHRPKGKNLRNAIPKPF